LSPLNDYLHSRSFSFFFTATATSEIYTLSLHDALPILPDRRLSPDGPPAPRPPGCSSPRADPRARRTPSQLDSAQVSHCASSWEDRKSTRLNSSHVSISYAVFCLKKKKKNVKLSMCYNT